MWEEIEEVYKSIKVPQWVHQNSKQASLFLSRKGIENLPSEALSPEYCPICESKMKKLELRYSYKRCPRCGYTQQDFKVSSDFLRGVSIAGSIALGLSLLIYFLSQDSKDMVDLTDSPA
jgi:hypothetical protein